MDDPKIALSPAIAPPPFGAYSHGVLVPAGRLLVTSGQLGLGADGDCPADLAEQARLCLATIDAILGEAGAGREHVLRLNAYVTRREDFAVWMKVRDTWLADVAVKPASTLMIVGGFTKAEFLVEIEALAMVP
ncbi:RidA family protein [Jannaschia donghaensis]|uniref:Enamine/imine deaminase n=1 Tax=Jannaschia donghaensis TaxID=420998 RepID=A0A0M6YDU9_9RHOB|nr:RidA family protein [Jannaschia donghaensis]CTQ48114.1 Enamine/imine deaminase [Jannaschia donghaensis]